MSKRKPHVECYKTVTRLRLPEGETEHRFRIVAGNGQIIAHGQAYRRKASMMKTIKTLVELAPDTEIRELLGYHGCP